MAAAHIEPDFITLSSHAGIPVQQTHLEDKYLPVTSHQDSHM